MPSGQARRVKGISRYASSVLRAFWGLKFPVLLWGRHEARPGHFPSPYIDLSAITGT